MLPYFAVYFTILMSLILNSPIVVKQMEKNGINLRKIKIYNLISDYKFLMLVMFLFAAMRGNGDGDYYNYINGVKFVRSLEFVFKPVNFPFEIGFRLLAFISNFLKVHPQFVIASMNLISFSLINKIIREKSCDKIFSLFLFFPIMLLFDMHHSRSAIAINSGLLFFDSLNKEEKIKTFFYFILGFSFHKSSIILLTLIPIKYLVSFLSSKRIDNRIMKFALILLFGLFIFVSFVNPLKIIIEVFNNPLTIVLYKKLNAYVNDTRWSYSFSLFDPRLWLNIYIYVWISLYFDSTDNYGKSLIIIQFLSVFTMLLFRHSTMLVMRIYNFFNIFIVISLTYFKNKHIKRPFSSCILNHLKISKVFERKLLYLFILMYMLYTLAIISKQVDYKVFFLSGFFETI